MSMSWNPGASYQGGALAAEAVSPGFGLLRSLIGDQVQRGRDTVRALAQWEEMMNTYGEGGAGATDEQGASEAARTGVGVGGDYGGELNTGGPAPQLDAAGNPMGNAGEVGGPVTPQSEQMGKMAKSLRGYIAAANPDAKNSVEHWSLEQLEGHLKGLAVKSTMQEHMARLRDYDAQAQERVQRAQDSVTQGQAVRNFYQAPGVPTGEGDNMRPANADERMAFMVQNTPGLGGRHMPEIIKSLAGYEQMGQDSADGGGPAVKEIYPGVSYITSRSGRGGGHVVTDPNAGTSQEDLLPGSYEDPVTGARFAYRGKSFQPAGFNPTVAGAGAQLIPQHDEDGKVVGWSQVDARGRATWVANRSAATFTQAQDQNGQPINGMYVDSQGKAHDTRTVMDKLMTAPGANGGSKSAERVTVRDKAGKQFTVPSAQLKEAIKQGYHQVGN